MHRRKTAASNPQANSTPKPSRRGEFERSKTHCKQGHPYSPENTRVTKQGFRQCRECSRANDRKRAKNPERRAAMDAAGREWQKRNRDRVNATIARYRNRHPEKVRERNKRRKHDPIAARARVAEWRKNNPDGYREWAKDNRHRLRAIANRRRVRELAASGMCSAEQWIARMDYHGNRCRYCGAGGKMVMEHMIPISRGGTGWPSNLVPACRRCNNKKYNKTYFEFVGLVASR